MPASAISWRSAAIRRRGERYRPHPGGYAYATDLVAGLRACRRFRGQRRGLSRGPSPGARAPTADLDNLKRKIDAGATRAITNFFFDADVYLRFLDRARRRASPCRSCPGILPVTNFAQTQKSPPIAARRCRPGWPAQFDGLDDDPDTRRLVAASIAAEQCRRLQAEGVSEFHFYTLNRADLIVAICHMIGVRGKETVRPSAAAANLGA